MEKTDADIIDADFKARSWVKRKKLPAPKLKVQLDVPHEDCLAYFAALIEKGMVFIMLEHTFPGTVLPEALRSKEHRRVGLNWSYAFKLPDFVFDEAGVRGSLSFSGKPIFCDVPWGAVAGIYAADGSSYATFEDEDETQPPPVVERSLKARVRSRILRGLKGLLGGGSKSR